MLRPSDPPVNPGSAARRGIPSLTIGLESVHDAGKRAVGINCDMKDLVHQEVVAGALADDPEVVYVSKDLPNVPEVAQVLGDPGGLVFRTGGRSVSR